MIKQQRQAIRKDMQSLLRQAAELAVRWVGMTIETVASGVSKEGFWMVEAQRLPIFVDDEGVCYCQNFNGAMVTDQFGRHPVYELIEVFPGSNDRSVGQLDSDQIGMALVLWLSEQGRQHGKDQTNDLIREVLNIGLELSLT